MLETYGQMWNSVRRNNGFVQHNIVIRCHEEIPHPNGVSYTRSFFAQCSCGYESPKQTTPCVSGDEAINRALYHGFMTGVGVTESFIFNLDEAVTMHPIETLKRPRFIFSLLS